MKSREDDTELLGAYKQEHACSKGSDRLPTRAGDVKRKSITLEKIEEQRRGVDEPSEENKTGEGS